MVTIITTLIEELEEDGSIPVDLLSALLTSVKMDKKVFPDSLIFLVLNLFLFQVY